MKLQYIFISIFLTLISCLQERTIKEDKPMELLVNDIVTVNIPLDTQQTPDTGEVIIIYGDTRTNHDIHQIIVDTIGKHQPKIIFHTGDLVSNGKSKKQWDVFNKITKKLRDSAVFYPVLGNHELHSELYFQNFNLTKNERWYAVVIENIKFIILDSNQPTATEQKEWLEKQLQNTPSNIRFIITLFHHPPFSSIRKDRKKIADHFVPLFEKYGVDIAFSGHNHGYERSKYKEICYIVAAGGGAPLYHKLRKNKYSRFFASQYNFCKLFVLDSMLCVETYSIENKLIDKLQIIKTKKEGKWQKICKEGLD